MSINNDNEFTERREGGLLIVSFKKDNAIVSTRSYCNEIHTEGGLVLEGIHGYLFVNRSKGEWDLQYKQDN